MQPAQPFVESKMHSNQDADTNGSSKPGRLSKRQLQHFKSSAEGGKPSEVSMPEEAPTTEKAKKVATSTSSTIVQETILVRDTQISQGSATFQTHVAVEDGNAENPSVQESNSDTSAKLQPSQPFVESKMHSNQDADTNGTSKHTRTSKRQLQHSKSSAEGEKLSEMNKPVRALTTEKACVVIGTSKNTQVQQGAIQHIINRTDGEETTRLRNRPDGSQKIGVWVKGNALVSQGEVVEVLRKDFVGEQGFAFIRTSNSIEGFVRSEYIQSTTSEAQDLHAKLVKKQKLNDNAFPVSRNSGTKSSLIAHASKEATESIDCSPAQVALKLEPVHSCLCIFAECNFS
jgi:hypothetical protein